jgi:cobalt/nickel transport system permease protein
MIVFNYNHHLANTPLAFRAIYIVPAFLLVYLTNTYAFNGLVILSYFILTKYITKSTFKQLFRLYAYPVLFLFIGCLTIAVSFRENMDYPLFSNPHVGFSKSDLALAINIFFRSMAVVSILFFGILTFSISEIATLMHSVRVPVLFIELFILTYKFIFNLASATKNMHTAQKLRLAYQKPGDVRTFSLLMAATFRRAFALSANLSIAIDARLGSGNFHFFSQRKQFKIHQIYGPSVFTSLLIIIFILFQYHG